MAVAVKVRGEPVTPVADAVKTFAPEAEPNVAKADAVPSVPVSWVEDEAPAKLPPPLVTDQMTWAPVTGCPAVSVTRTTKGVGS